MEKSGIEGKNRSKKKNEIREKKQESASLFLSMKIDVATKKTLNFITIGARTIQTSDSCITLHHFSESSNTFRSISVHC